MKKQLVVLGAAAIIAAAAVPALALEHEAHGMYRLRAMATNFQSAGAATLGPKATQQTYTLFEQRARLQYIAKASDDLKLVTHFEIDSTWGDAAYQNGRGQGGGLAADTVNLETKHVFLDFNLAKDVNAKVGIQGVADAYKGIFLFDDAAGVMTSGKFGAVATTLGFLRLYEGGGTTATGRANVDAYIVDLKLNPSKAMKLGASYYLVNNDAYGPSYQTHTVGVNAALNMGAADIDAFVMYQTGEELYRFNQPGVPAGSPPATPAIANRDLSAYAAQVAAKIKLGSVGVVRAAGLLASGDNGTSSTKNKAFQNTFASGAAGAAAGSSTSSGQYYSANMLIILRTIIAMDSDQSLVSSINNKNQGIQAGFLGFDANMTEKLSANANAGFVWADKRNNFTPATATSKYYGTELNLALNYKLYPNLTTTLQGAYVMLGDYYKSSPEKKDPFLTGVTLTYAF